MELKKIEVNEQSLRKLIALASTQAERLALASANRQFSGNRNLNTVLGYPAEYKAGDYLGKYKRQDIAAAIIEAYPSATWEDSPIVREVRAEGASDDPTEFEQAWESITERINVWHYAERVDVLAGLGRYAVLVLGFRDTDNLAAPIDRASADDLVWMRPYMESSAEIKYFVTDTQSARFGLPLLYTIKTGDGKGGTNEVNVHWTRVIHVAEGLLEDDVYGTPRLERVMDRLHDLLKIIGGDAETFWKNARGILNAKAQADAEITDDALSTMRDQIDDLVNQLRNWVGTNGVDLQAIQLDIADPKNHADVILAIVSAASRIPKRILIGNEQGELASTSDDGNWAKRIKERRKKFAQPIIVYQLLDRLKQLGALADVKYTAEWPALNTLSETQKAEIALKKAQALQAYAPLDQRSVVPPEIFLSEVMGLSEEQVKRCVELINGDEGDDLV